MIYTAYQDGSDGIGGVSVVSGGHIFAQKGRHICRPDGREDYLLLYMERGRELFYFSSDAVAERGDFVIFRPHERQDHIYVGEETGELYYIHFNAPQDFDLFGFESSCVYRTRADAKHRDIFEEVISELTLKRTSYEKLCTSMLFALMALLKRNSTAVSDTLERYFDKVFFVISSMNKDFGSDISLEGYADMCNMSKFHFLRVFKDITGRTPMEYKNAIRIEHAKELLENTCDSISDIGKKTGFMSDAYFCSAFKKNTGMSPSEYRKNM